MSNPYIPTLNPFLLDPLVRAALAEDFGRAGDLTTLAIVPPERMTEAVFRARGPGVVAGVAVITATFAALDPQVSVTLKAADGAKVAAGADIAVVKGPARAILGGERVALNFLGRMCGIATMTRTYVDKVAHTGASIVCTRKTTPGLRAVEKFAVRCGGGGNHRFGLDDAILIKDNHIAVAGGVRQAIELAKRAAGAFVKIEVEIDRLDQLADVLAAGADIVMFDNMSAADIRQGVQRVAGKMIIEASGGVNLDTVKEIAETGVNLISVGALTHSSKVLDIGLDIDI